MSPHHHGRDLTAACTWRGPATGTTIARQPSDVIQFGWSHCTLYSWVSLLLCWIQMFAKRLLSCPVASVCRGENSVYWGNASQWVNSDTSKH